MKISGHTKLSGKEGWVDLNHVHMQIKVWGTKTAPAVLELQTKPKDLICQNAQNH